jgi:3-hydroxy-9,10-secoandrosta-1,3,5(10)-triene-9,17-dione monooxygenase reductase component
MQFDSKIFRQALGCFATGVTVVTTRAADGSLVGVTVNSFAALSLDPPLILWSLRLQSSLTPIFNVSKSFVVHVLDETQRALSDRFARRETASFSDIDIAEDKNGCPIMANALAVYQCQTESVILGGDHTIFIGRVESVSSREGRPLLFAAGRYALIA